MATYYLWILLTQILDSVNNKSRNKEVGYGEYTTSNELGYYFAYTYTHLINKKPVEISHSDFTFVKNNYMYGVHMYIPTPEALNLEEAIEVIKSFVIHN